jgi:hypothetical protein
MTYAKNGCPGQQGLKGRKKEGLTAIPERDTAVSRTVSGLLTTAQEKEDGRYANGFADVKVFCNWSEHRCPKTLGVILIFASVHCFT